MCKQYNLIIHDGLSSKYEKTISNTVAYYNSLQKSQIPPSFSLMLSTSDEINHVVNHIIHLYIHEKKNCHSPSINL